MNRSIVVGIGSALLLLRPAAGAAQHEGHAAGAATAGPEVALCAKAQPVVNQLLASAMARIEAARQTNGPAQMRAAIDDLQGVLRDVRAQLEPCAKLADDESTADPHAGHSMNQPGRKPR